jgi:hypothetical protein
VEKRYGVFVEPIFRFPDEPSSPVKYMERVVASALPGEVKIGDVATLLGVKVDEKQADALSKELLALIKTSAKSQYRSEEEMASLAETDARLYAAAMAYEAKTGRRRRGRALGGSCYLITASLRFIRAVERALGQPDEVSARPNTLAALFQLVGRSEMSARDFVALFDNPLLQHVVSLCRDDVEELLDAGLSIRGKTLPRLIWDLDRGLHERLAVALSSERRADETLGDKEELEFDRSYLELVKEAGDRGYRPLPAAERMMHEITELRAERADLSTQVDELAERVKEIESAAEVFGRRKRRYLQKIAQGKPHHKAH